MVCPKLSAGSCKITKKVCAQPYRIKMINYKSCKVYKKAPAKALKTKKKVIRKIRRAPKKKKRR